MIRHAAKRHRRLFAFVPRGQRDIEDPRRGLRVLKKHFIEIAESKKKNRVAVPLFDLQVLLHHRSDLGGLHRLSGGPGLFSM